MSSISIKKAAIINFVSRYFNIFIQLIINSVLARLLTPDDYGVVAVINVFITFFTILADMGIGPAIIYNRKLNEKEVSDIFIFTIFTGIITSIGFSVFSNFISYFYSDSIYRILGPILSISILFYILNIVPNALLLKEKKFKLLGIRTILINLLGGIISIILAILNFKYYSLVINSILISIITFVVNYYSCKIKIYTNFSMKSLKKIQNFSTYQFGFSFINYFSRNLDNLLIGKVLGASALGYYDKAYRLMLYPVQNLTFVISPVLQPILSDFQDDIEYIYFKYINILKSLSLIGVFFGTICYFISNEIIIIMFGDEWINSIEAFKILSISIWFQIVTSSTGSIFQTVGKTKELFKCGLITTSINIILIILGLFFRKIEFIAIGVTTSYILSFFVAYSILIKKIFRKSMISFLRNFLNHSLISITIILGLNIFKYDIDNNLISILYKVFIGGIFYLIALLFTKEYKIFIEVFKKR